MNETTPARCIGVQPPSGRGQSAFRASAWLLGGLYFLTLMVPLASLFTERELTGWLPAAEDMPEVIAAVWLTAWTSISVVAVSIVLGLPAAYLLATRRFRGAVLIDTLVDIPIALPPVVCGVALLFAVSPSGLLGPTLSRLGIQVLFNPLGIVAVQSFVAMPYLIRAARGAFEAVPPHLAMAMRVMGAGEHTIFLRLYLPMAFRGIFAGAVMAWTRAIGEFGATLLIVGAMPFRTQTMSIAIYVNGFMSANKEVMFFLAFVFIFLAFSILAALRTFFRSEEVPWQR